MFVVDLRNSTIKNYMFSVIGNKNVDTVYLYSRFTQYAEKHIYVKVLSENFADKILVDSNDITVKDGCLIVKWTMGAVATACKKVQVQLSFEDNINEQIAQSAIATITLADTLDIDNSITPTPSVVEQLQRQIDVLHNESVASADASYANDTLTINLKNADNEIIQTIEVEIGCDDNAYVSAEWDGQTQKITLTKADGQTTTELDLSGAFDTKVDKVQGKGLSTNDFTNELKTKLDNVEAGAQANVLEGVKVNNQPLTPTNKVVNIDLSSYALIADMQTYGKSLAVSIDPQTYVLTMSLKDANGNILNTQTVDLPLETMVVSGSYDDTTKSLILVLKNGQTITIPVADLVAGLVSEQQLAQTLQSYYTKTETNNLLAKKVNYYDVGDLWFDELENDFVSNLNAGDVVNAQGITGVVITASQYEKVIQYFEYDTNDVYRIIYYFNEDENIWEYDYGTQNCLMPDPNQIDDHYILRKESGGWLPSTAPKILAYNNLLTIPSSDIADWQLGDVISFGSLIFTVSWVTSTQKRITAIDITNTMGGGTNKHYTYIYMKNGNNWSYNSRLVNQVGELPQPPIPPMIEIEWGDLKEMRDNGELVKGQQYCIIDYVCTTDQPYTASANNGFDIIVVADSENTLNEKARARVKGGKFGIYSESMGWWFYRSPNEDGFFSGGDTFYYAFCHYDEDEDRYYYIYLSSLTDKPTNTTAIVFYDSDDEYYISLRDNPIDWELLSADGETIDDDNIYFITSRLEAWELWYCLDNDTNRFGWARHKAIQVDDGNDTYVYVRLPQNDSNSGYAWAYVNNSDSRDFDEVGNWFDYDTGDIIYSNTPNVEIGDTLIMSGDEVTVTDVRSEGRGVIYRMIDEWNNDIPYDFKNIMFYRWIVQDIGSYTHPFEDDDFIGVPKTITGDVRDYELAPIGYEDEGWDDYELRYTFSWLNDDGDVLDYSILANVSLITDEGKIAGCFNNKIERYVDSYEEHRANAPSRQWLNNIVFIDKFANNDGETYGIYCNEIKGASACDTFLGSYIKYNVIGGRFLHNTIGAEFYSNNIGSECIENNIGSGANNNNIGSYFNGNEISNVGFSDNQIGNTIMNCQFYGYLRCSVLGSDIRNSSLLCECKSIIIDSNNSVYLDKSDEGDEIKNIHIHTGATKNRQHILAPTDLDYSIDYYANGSTEIYLEEE